MYYTARTKETKQNWLHEQHAQCRHKLNTKQFEIKETNHLYTY